MRLLWEMGLWFGLNENCPDPMIAACLATAFLLSGGPQE